MRIILVSYFQLNDMDFIFWPATEEIDWIMCYDR